MDDLFEDYLAAVRKVRAAAEACRAGGGHAAQRRLTSAFDDLDRAHAAYKSALMASAQLHFRD